MLELHNGTDQPSGGKFRDPSLPKKGPDHCKQTKHSMVKYRISACRTMLFDNAFI